MKKHHHAGMIVKSDDPNRVRELLETYSEEFARRFLASMPRPKNQRRKRLSQGVCRKLLECAPCMTASSAVKQNCAQAPVVVGAVSRAPYFGVHLDP